MSNKCMSIQRRKKEMDGSCRWGRVSIRWGWLESSMGMTQTGNGSNVDSHTRNLAVVPYNKNKKVTNCSQYTLSRYHHFTKK